jgi:hypothetical protein
MNTLQTTNGTFTSFMSVASSIGKEITSVHGKSRAAKFDEIYTSYDFNDGVLTLTTVSGKSVAMRLQDLILGLREPAMLPVGNGLIDKVIDGKGGDDTANKVKYLQTAADYLAHALDEHADVMAIYTLVNQPAKTNEQFKAIIEAVKAVLLPTTQAETYAAMVTVEAGINQLQNLGFEFTSNCAWVDKENVRTYKGTISQTAITEHGNAIGQLITVIDQPVAKTTGDLFAGTIATAFEVTFQFRTTE